VTLGYVLLTWRSVYVDIAGADAMPDEDFLLVSASTLLFTLTAVV
jgi:hypothetical protein